MKYKKKKAFFSPFKLAKCVVFRDLIDKFNGELIRIVGGGVIRMKCDDDVLALSCGNASLHRQNTENTKPIVVLRPCA